MTDCAWSSGELGYYLLSHFFTFYVCEADRSRLHRRNLFRDEIQKLLGPSTARFKIHRHGDSHSEFLTCFFGPLCIPSRGAYMVILVFDPSGYFVHASSMQTLLNRLTDCTIHLLTLRIKTYIYICV